MRDLRALTDTLGPHRAGGLAARLDEATLRCAAEYVFAIQLGRHLFGSVVLAILDSWARSTDNGEAALRIREDFQTWRADRYGGAAPEIPASLEAQLTELDRRESWGDERQLAALTSFGRDAEDALLARLAPPGAHRPAIFEALASLGSARAVEVLASELDRALAAGQLPPAPVLEGLISGRSLTVGDLLARIAARNIDLGTRRPPSLGVSAAVSAELVDAAWQAEPAVASVALDFLRLQPKLAEVVLIDLAAHHPQPARRAAAAALLFRP